MTVIFIILGLLVVNGLFAMAEAALLSSRKTRLEIQANKGDSKARKALDLANHPDTFLSTVQMGVTLIGILMGIFSGENLTGPIIVFLHKFPLLQHYEKPIATTITVIFITYLSLVIGELVPKRIGLSRPEVIAKAVAKPMGWVTIITYPFILLLTKSTQLIAAIFNIRKNDAAVTEEEIKAMISEGTEHGDIEETEQEIIERVFHLGDRNITSLMTHRSDIVWMDMTAKVADVKEKMKEVIHNTYPLCKGVVDNIKGVVTIKDILLADNETPLSEIMMPALFVPENNTVYQVLEKFKSSQTHSCFIVDEYGSVEGMMTLNDILEAIVGDMAPSYEDDYLITEREDGTFLTDAQIPFYDFLTRFEKTEYVNEGEQNFNTLAGFILHQLQSIPKEGDRLTWKGFDFEIMDMDGNRIDKVLITVSEDIKEGMEE